VLPNFVGKVGLWVTLQWTYGRAQRTLHIPIPRSLNVWPRFLEHPVKLRARTSDTGIFQECMVEEEYLPLKGLPVATILDLGVNVGLLSAWFLSRFQGAKTFAVEAKYSLKPECVNQLSMVRGAPTVALVRLMGRKLFV